MRYNPEVRAVFGEGKDLPGFEFRDKIMGRDTEKNWLLPGFIILAIACLFLITARFGQQAQARAELQPTQQGGIMVVPIQIERDLYGLAMIDTTSQTLWIYEMNSRGPAYNRLKLTAARSWKYDKFLQQYNTAEPKPEQVRMILENLGKSGKNETVQEQPPQDLNPQKKIEPNNAALVEQIIDTDVNSNVKTEPNKGDLNKEQQKK